MNESGRLADSHARLLAETAWDHNVVVAAGAGTGKTTILVNRILNLLMREPDPLAITEIAAMTFTNKAATEMKLRLRRELTKLSEEPDGSIGSMFRSRYRVSGDLLQARAAHALAHLEKAQIGTLHSFAAHLLRLHPIESGLDPSFREDDGSRLTELFDRIWARWLDDELGDAGHQHDRWRVILAGSSLDDLRQLATLLTNELIDLDALIHQLGSSQVEGPLRDWIASLHVRATRLLSSRASHKTLKAEQMLSAAVTCLSLLLEQGLAGLATCEASEHLMLGRGIGKPTVGWDPHSFREAAGIIASVRQLLGVDQAYLHNVVDLLQPMLSQVRERFLTSGWISFDGLLARARTLLRDCSHVRAEIKSAFRAILVDEFQDTDPVQYEIILYLAERAGRHDVVWDQIDLKPGKLFIVGDPKQSIYSFRRADIEAFERVTEKILAQGGAAYALTTNFRSDRGVLDVVNDLFDRLFTPSPHVQPSHERLTVRPDRQPEVSPAGVQVRLVVPKEDDEPFDAATATRTEAEALARWITDTLAHATVVDPQNRRVPLQPGQIALIFRKLTHAQDYLDALRRYGIQYMTDGEKHFYRRQEIIDLINVLRVIDNPQDRIALVGLLRSPLGGIPDQTLFELSQLHCLDYTKPECLAASGHPSAATLGQLYHTLNDLRRSAPLRPVPDAIELLFDRLPILELAAASLHGEQAVANLVKVRILAEELADRPHLTLTGFVEVMRERLIDEPEEAESALAEESPDAVRVLTIHKAKGLEFPVVILPGLHQGSRLPDKGPTLHHDWSTRLYGIRMKDRSNLGSLVVDAKIQAREQAEQQRLLYVGMTRARDLLVLSGGRTATNGRDSVLSLLEDAIPELTGYTAEGPISLGTGRLTQVVIPTSATTRQHRPERHVVKVPVPSLHVLTKRRAARVDRWSAERLSERRLTPSLLMSKRPPVRVAASLRPPDKVESRLLGVCAHSLLEEWNFASLDGDLVSAIERACVRHLPAERLDEGQTLRQELQAMFASFLVSKPYARLQRATMLGREVPFVIPWDGQYVMEGIIDVIYRLDGRLWIADYKTDLVTAGEASARAETYRRQAEIYRAAVKQSLGMDASFQFVFLRPAVTIDM